MKIYKDIKQEYVSFDVFDTLLYRDVEHYNMIFDIMEEELIKIYGNKFNGFSNIRKTAQINAEASNKVEATLDDIYELTSYDSKTIKLLKDFEIKIESEHLHPNNDLKLIINKLKDKKKKIIVTSDMYLDEKVISDFLHENGFNFDKIYVSSNLQLRKGNGQIFKYILDDLNIKKSQLIHIGDNLRSDFFMPRLKGIKSIRYLDRKKHFKSNNKSLEKILNNSYQNNYYEEIGFNYFGPLLYGFCKWINSIKEQNNLDDICFLARDGQIVEKAYKLIYPESNYKYLLVSRRSLTVPLLYNANSFEDIFDIVTYIKRNETVRDLLYKLGVEDDSIIKEVESKFGKEISRDDIKNKFGKEIFCIIEKNMKENALNEMLCAKEYIKNNLLDGNIGIVDIGWYGTIQNSLKKLCKEFKINKSFTGLYVGFLERKDNKTLNAYGYVYDYRKKMNFKNYVFGFNGLIELMFTADHGSAKKYKKDNKKVVCELEKNNGEYSEFVKDVQTGALEFTKCAVENNLEINEIDSYLELNKLLCSPTLKECYLLGDEKFYDVYFEKIIQFNGWSNFIKSPKNSIKNFLKSNWKIGYLKKMFPKSNASLIYEIMNKLK